MATVKDVFNACQNSVSLLDKKDITNKIDLAKNLSRALGEDYVVIHNYKNHVGITPLGLDTSSKEPLFVVKSTFTKEHGLKHCVIKLNPRLWSCGMRFDTPFSEACVFIRCLHQQDKIQCLIDKLSTEGVESFKYLKEIVKRYDFIKDNLKDIRNEDLKSCLEWRGVNNA